MSLPPADDDFEDEQEWPTFGCDLVLLANLWHTSAIALSTCSRYERKLWASERYARVHPETSPTAAYKVLDRSPWTHGGADIRMPPRRRSRKAP